MPAARLGKDVFIALIENKAFYKEAKKGGRQERKGVSREGREGREERHFL